MGKNSLKVAFSAAAGVAFDSAGFDSFDMGIVTRKGVVACVAGCGGGGTNIGVVIGSASGAIFGLIGLAAYVSKKKKEGQKQDRPDRVQPDQPATADTGAAAASHGKSVGR